MGFVVKKNMLIALIWLELITMIQCSSLLNTNTNCDQVNFVTDGTIESENLDYSRISISKKVYQFRLKVNKTVCLYAHLPHLNNENQNFTKSTSDTVNNTVLYTLQYQGLRQVYPIKSEYIFGVPQLESDCKCDCSGGEDHCPVEQSYLNCNNTSNGICGTTFNHHVRSTGCFAGAEAKICCKITVTPYKNLKFHAVYLDQPSVEGQFLFKISVSNGNDWEMRNEETIKVSLNRNVHQEFQEFDMQISANVPPNMMLNPGMYFYENSSTSRLKSGEEEIHTNRLNGWSATRLGWFRLIKNQWTFDGHESKLAESHKVKVDDCKGQRYSETYNNAEYYCVKNKSGIWCHQSVDAIISDQKIEKLWINSVVLPNHENGVDRQVVVNVGNESPSVSVDISLDSKMELKFLFHESSVQNFSGLMILDKNSNKYFNVTYINAKGTLLGRVYTSDSKKTSIRSFSSEVVHENPNLPLTNFSDLIRLPPEVKSSKYICISASGKKTKEICNWVEYYPVPVEYIYKPTGWNPNEGNCPGCNEFTWNNFLKYLDPREWFNGVTSFGEVFSLVLEVGFYIIIIFLVIFVCRRCVCPFMKVVLCCPSPTPQKTIV